MNNYYLALSATLLCLILGCLASWFVVFDELAGLKLVLSSSLGVVCLPLGVSMGILTFQEFDSARIDL